MVHFSENALDFVLIITRFHDHKQCYTQKFFSALLYEPIHDSKSQSFITQVKNKKNNV